MTRVLKISTPSQDAELELREAGIIRSCTDRWIYQK